MINISCLEIFLTGCSFSLQLHSAVQNHTEVDSVGLHVGSSLLGSLKQRVVNLASSSGVLPTIQVLDSATEN